MGEERTEEREEEKVKRRRVSLKSVHGACRPEKDSPVSVYNLALVRSCSCV